KKPGRRTANSTEFFPVKQNAVSHCQSGVRFAYYCTMADLKEDYYFQFVPEREKARGSNIDWKSYNSIISVVLTYSALEARLARFLARWDLFPSAFNLLAILARTDGEGMHLSRISEL